jgi:hypothetical protein
MPARQRTRKSKGTNAFITKKKTTQPARQPFTCFSCKKEYPKTARRATYDGSKFCWPCAFPFTSEPTSVAVISGHYRGTDAENSRFTDRNVPRERKF